MVRREKHSGQSELFPALAAALVPLKLREYQEISKDKSSELLFDCQLNVLLYLATGGGKTETATAIASEAKKRGLRTLFVVHRNDLVYQTKKRFEKYGLKVGIIKSGEQRIENADIYVLSIGSLASRIDIIKALNFGLIIIDEAHNYFNQRAYKLYELYKDTNTVILGLTATPFLESKWKADDKIPQFWLGDESKPTYKDHLIDGKLYRNYYYKSFGYVYHEIVATTLPSELMNAGYLVPCQPFTYNMFTSAGRKIEENGEYDDTELARIFTEPSFLKHITDLYLKIPLKANGKRRQGLAFCISIEHSKMLCQVLIDHGIKAVHVDCNTPKKIRSQIYSDYENYLIDIISSVDVVSEGFDMPQAEVGLMCRPTASLIKLVQQMGRLLRPFPGKEDCIVLDQANNTKDIKSRFLLQPQGFHPYDALNLSAYAILNISEPKLPDEIELERTEKGEGKVKEAGVLGNDGQLTRPYSEQQAEIYIKYAQEESWNAQQLQNKFLQACLFPSLEAIYHLSTFLNLSEQQSEKLYYSCWLYSSSLLSMDCPIAEASLDFETIKRIKNLARTEFNRYSYILKTQQIVPDYAPANNNFLNQLIEAHKKSKDNAYYLFQVLRTKLEADVRNDKTPENEQKLYRLFSDYDILKRKYKRARNADKKIT